MSDKLQKRPNPKELKKIDYIGSAGVGIGVWAFVPFIGGPVTGLIAGGVFLGWRWVKRKTS